MALRATTGDENSVVVGYYPACTARAAEGRHTMVL